LESIPQLWGINTRGSLVELENDDHLTTALISFLMFAWTGGSGFEVRVLSRYALTASLCVFEVAKYHRYQNSVANKSEIESARPSTLRFVGHILPVAAILCWLGDYTNLHSTVKILASNLLTNGLSLVLIHPLMSARAT
jgi:hypothetical protein